MRCQDFLKICVDEYSYSVSKCQILIKIIIPLMSPAIFLNRTNPCMYPSMMRHILLQIFRVCYCAGSFKIKAFITHIVCLKR